MHFQRKYIYMCTIYIGQAIHPLRKVFFLPRQTKLCQAKSAAHFKTLHLACMTKRNSRYQMNRLPITTSLLQKAKDFFKLTYLTLAFLTTDYVTINISKMAKNFENLSSSSILHWSISQLRVVKKQPLSLPQSLLPP